MLLFKPFHVSPILRGEKTMTMRRWAQPRVRVGAVHECRTQLFKGQPFARVRILKVYRQRLGGLTAEQYNKEGGYTRESFLAVWKDINQSYEPDEIYWAVEFELVEEC